MEIKIKYEPVFELTLTKQVVESLVELSESHYDYACKRALAQGGLLFKWLNQIEFGTPCTATFRELDLTLKIAECETKSKLINGYCAMVRGVMTKSGQYASPDEALREAVVEAHRIILHEMDNGRTPTMLKAENGGKGLGYFEDLITT
tara:strand:+ start:14362 stop:14805 length:444 start_codon:yes stop_codon:yes gene_type:complete